MKKLLSKIKPYTKWIFLSLAIIFASVLLLLPGNDIGTLEMNLTLEGADNYAPFQYHNLESSFPPSSTESLSLTEDSDSFPMLMEDSDVVSLDFSLDRAASYTIELVYKDVSSFILPSEIEIKINGESPFRESENIKLPALWGYDDNVFPIDRYGNEVLPRSSKQDIIQTTRIHDTTGLNQMPLLFPFERGTNTLEISVNNGSFELFEVLLKPQETLPAYEDTLSASPSLASDSIILSATDVSLRNSPSVRLYSVNDASAIEYAIDSLKLNTIDGSSYRLGNDTIYFDIEVTEAGYYHIGFKYRQDLLMQMPAFRELRINGEIPFEEARLLQFHATSEFRNLLLGDPDPYMFYLEEGTHEIALRAVMEPYRDVYHTLVSMMEEISDLSLEIKKLTGNTSDRYRTWDIERFIPDTNDRLTRWIETLNTIESHLTAYTHFDEPGAITNLKIARERLEELAEDVNQIPSNMMLLADGNTSASQLIGSTVQMFLENGLDIQSVYVTGSDDLPRESANIFTRAWVSTYRFFESFGSQDYQVSDVEEGVLEIWINHPRQYIEIIQSMVDRDFVDQTGIDVQISLMPDENKLVLANAADNAPDVAVGVNHWIPYELAIRGASLDLRQFDGFEETVSQFMPGVMVPYAFEEGIFGLPETQNFWVTYYREDILDSLNIPIPDTWNEVIEILPELQRFDMNYYQPLAFFRGFKPFVATIPFIYQFGGSLYSEDGMSTTINTEESIEGITLMSELFTVYNLPKEVPNFYQHFRYGTMPIGISDLSTYLQLSIAAPEIAGKWNIDLHPGVENADGDIERWAASGAQASMIMSSTDMPEEAFEFLSWWMSTDVQSQFAIQLQTTYGTEYLWNTANVEAFKSLPLPKEHIDIITAQWEYALEASRIPGSFMVEREISNAWNQIVFDDTNPRITLDEAVRSANREILYKMQEFDYVENGVVLKPYTVPTIHNIENWLTERDNGSD